MRLMSEENKPEEKGGKRGEEKAARSDAEALVWLGRVRMGAAGRIQEAHLVYAP